MQALDIGFIGLGVVGAPMAGHLARAGHRLTLDGADPAVARAMATGPGAGVSELARWVGMLKPQRRSRRAPNRGRAEVRRIPRSWG